MSRGIVPGRGRGGFPPFPPSRIRAAGRLTHTFPTGVDDGSQMRETVLPNGVRVLTERIPGVRSVAAGVWVQQGAAHETPELQGASHLLEHLVFKGTENRSPREIAIALEGLGGSLDAYTSREHTSYQARVLDEHFPQALEVLADIILNPSLRASDLELEREVVLEEISTVEDTPDDLVFELHGEALWRGHPYGRSILGTRESVGQMEVESLRRIHQERYLAGSLVVAVAGRLEHDEVVERVHALFGHLPEGGHLAVANVGAFSPPKEERVSRPAAQSHIVFGTVLPPRTDPRRFPLILLSSAFGGGMSSRLFQRVREELALAYTVFSFQSFYSQAGASGVYVGTRPGWADRAVSTIEAEFERLAREGLDEDELESVKNQVKGQVMLSLESTSSRLFRLAGFALYGQEYLTLDDLLARIDRISIEEAAAVAREFYAPEKQFVLRLGPPEGSDPDDASSDEEDA